MASLFFALTISLLSTTSVYAQSEPKVETSAIYLSETDDLVSIKTIGVLPSSDNVDGIYSRPLEEELRNIIKQSHRFQLSTTQFTGAVQTPEQLEQDPELVKSLTQNLEGEAVLATRAYKSADSLTIQMSMFLKKDGKLFSREVSKETKSFDVSRLKIMTHELFKSVIRVIPYDGVVLSRSGGLVTVNLGKKDGIKPGQILTAVLIIKLQRHPKLNFLINSEKEVLGKIKIQKVDETISFGDVISEKDIGTIRKGNKISGVEFVTYSESSQLNPQSPTNNPADTLAFGETPKEWRPSDPPTFGKVGLSLGFGQLRYNTKLQSAGSLNGESNFYPTFLLTGQLWMTQNWLADIEIEQGVATIDNPLSGSNPSDLSVNISNYSLAFGYNFLIQDDFFGPSILASLGFGSYGLDVDSSTPIGLTSTRYKGWFLGIKGTLPVSEDKRWNAGVSLQYFLKSDLTESPQGSSGPDNTITRFSLLGFYQQNSRLRLTGALDFALYSTDYSGQGSRPDPADTASQKYTVLRGGIEYLF